jgi:hypothetical protein
MTRAARLNAQCLCRTLDEAALAQAFDRWTGEAGFTHRLLASHPHLFATTPVFVQSQDAQAMEDIVAAFERLARLPAWAGAVLASSPAIARRDFGPKGVFMGFDFHIDPGSGPRLIEINTNAGGGFLNLGLMQAQASCCEDSARALGGLPDVEALIAGFIAMFRAEHALRLGAGAKLGFVAILDDDPKGQYLLPEFLLAKALFERSGIAAAIADPSELAFAGGRLLLGGRPVDLVYNRVTDFDLSHPAHRTLAQAYAEGAATVTPGPRDHALLADKRNLVLLSDPEALRGLGVAEPDILLFARHVPKTVEVTQANAQALWAERKFWFFKPASGFGARAAYRGDKMTKKVWEETVQAGRYVAQSLVPPAERGVVVEGQPARMKSDIRAYAYAGQAQLLAARLYQGQTTNFRTQGGGFAPVLVA